MALHERIRDLEVQRRPIQKAFDDKHDDCNKAAKRLGSKAASRTRDHQKGKKALNQLTDEKTLLQDKLEKHQGLMDLILQRQSQLQHEVPCILKKLLKKYYKSLKTASQLKSTGNVKADIKAKAVIYANASEIYEKKKEAYLEELKDIKKLKSV